MGSLAVAGMAAASATPVTVEIVASGHVETPATAYRVSGNVLACAATQAEADRLLAQKTAAIDQSVTAIGARKA
ncbi:hypothetical protein U1701_12510 [Sphingomonas sp. PB2P19]|uniref:hypothetical protein n=1 Tax=Sphingomonas rhamnosi TaxID=3096156 RepID=UPI002FCC1564